MHKRFLVALLAVVVAAALFPASASAQAPPYLLQWGGFGDSPFAVAVDGSGSVYVTGGNRIQKFTSDGAYLLQWGAQGSGNGQFESPRGVAVDGSGNVYVADCFNNRIQVFGPGLVPAQSTSWGRIKSRYR
jgi:DNA-binding beta-propeller fold protein YncE